MIVALATNIFRPDWSWTWIAAILLLHGPRMRQGMVDRGDVVMQESPILSVEINPLLDDGLIVLVQRNARAVERAGSFEAASFDFEQVVTSVAIGIDPFADRIARERRLFIPGPIASIRINAA